MFYPFYAKFYAMGCCGSNSAVFYVRKTASLLMRARFQPAVPAYHGLSFFFLERLSSFFLKRRKKDAEKICLSFTLYFRLIQIKYSPAGAYPPPKFEIKFSTNTRLTRINYPLCIRIFRLFSQKKVSTSSKRDILRDTSICSHE